MKRQNDHHSHQHTAGLAPNKMIAKGWGNHPEWVISPLWMALTFASAVQACRILGTALKTPRCAQMNDWVVNFVGSAAALCSITSFAPQMIKIWKERDASSVSLKTYAMTVTCFVLWVVYGAMTQTWPVTAANSCALLMASGVLFMKWRFRDAGAMSKGALR